ncbi:PAS domain S-box-containing protein [Parapedobacter luteus]|uniref:histidine kinase n=1 Tax=Parapedobacter luteus TaxID=623280 RepID=A0A1T5BB29_9SPHI|nr:sensor histidine kinase [Parapedobacter luteus]SKB44472.1 PAS domain S-box-containing protein [Parapedobacter luteus]
MMEGINELYEKLARLEKENAALKLRNDELADFFENASIPLHWVDGEGIIIWANQAELDVLGYTKEEYVGLPISNFHADPETIQDILTRLSNNETLHNYSARLKCKDGSIRHVLISSNVLRTDGKFVHTRCFTKDVTSIVEEEKRRNSLLLQLEESEARLRMAITSTNLGTWDWDTQTANIYLSAEGKRICGFPSEEPVSFEKLSDLIHPDDRQQVDQEVKRSTESGIDGLYDIIFRIHRFDDHRLCWVRVQGAVYLDAKKDSTRFTGTMLDITDIKQAEEKSAQLAAIIRTSNDAIISITLDGIVTSWNASAQRMFGYTAKEMVCQTILKIVPEDRQDEEAHILSRLRSGLEVEHFDTKRLTKKGNLLDVSLTLSPIKDAGGNIIGISKITRDITGKKQEERRKNDFVAMASHELKTPLTAITGFAQILMNHSKKAGDDFSWRVMSRIEAQAKKMGSMIQGFLSLARIEGGKIELRKEVFELDALVSEIVDDAKLLGTKHFFK